MSSEEGFPVMGTELLDEERGLIRIPGGRIPWKVAEVVYEGYKEKFGTTQSLERLAERGGFGWGEIALFWDAGRRSLAGGQWRADREEE